MSDMQIDQSEPVGWAIHLPMLSMSRDPNRMGFCVEGVPPSNRGQDARDTSAHPSFFFSRPGYLPVSEQRRGAWTSCLSSLVAWYKKDFAFLKNIWHLHNPQTAAVVSVPVAVYCTMQRKTMQYPICTNFKPEVLWPILTNSPAHRSNRGLHRINQCRPRSY